MNAAQPRCLKCRRFMSAVTGCSRCGAQPALPYTTPSLLAYVPKPRPVPLPCVMPDPPVSWWSRNWSGAVTLAIVVGIVGGSATLFL